MRVPAYIRFTLAELTAYGLQSAEVLARANSAIHLVLTEQQQFLTSQKMQAACSIISVEDADGITVAVLKHPKGEAWDRRPLSAVVATPDGIEVRDLRSGAGASQVVRLDVLGRDPNYVAKGVRSEPEPVVPRREPPHAAPAGKDRFQRGVSAMYDMLKRAMEIGRLRSFGAQFDSQRPNHDIVMVDGEISLAGLARAFLAAYQPQITISEEVRFKLAVTAMKESLHRQFKDGGMERITWGECGLGGDDPKKWPGIIGVEGDIDMDALGRAFWSVMKGEG